ncbi:hypothetical protein [Aureispira sp. CCB-E]|uniref:hypothetical protein n=1 Tax=Aureispira sp. CCB-E TaxID=3051121 RepID=UPI002868FD57|nr:hypothetical protein [Aureispira sp. CCB-E]WMX16475.1 hypothetical protein QP953_08850 [Aureispira sp. CCB-E]
MLQKILLILFSALALTGVGQVAKALPNGHAHNDYEKKWPAFKTALSKGFVSLEIDVFPYKNQLKVAHIDFFLNVAPELEALYFKPLEEWLSKKGKLFEDSTQRLIFMIDIKRSSSKSYALLRTLCMRYKHLITHYYPDKDSVSYGVLDILLSGNKPYEQVLRDSVRYMLIDGGLEDINDSIRTAAIAPRVSGRYASVFSWRGKGEMPHKELTRLRKIVATAHADNRKVRFWGMPNKPVVWKLLLDEGVDWMNVDALEAYRLFYQEYQQKE